MVSDEANELRLNLCEVINRARRGGISAKALATEFRVALYTLDMVAKWDKLQPEASLH